MKKLERRISAINNLETRLDQAGDIQDYKKFEKKADIIRSVMLDFYRIIRFHHKPHFPYMEQFLLEYKYLDRFHIPIIENFGGTIRLTPFDMVLKASEIVVLQNGDRIKFPEDLKAGNTAIGQAYLSDGTEVFCPRYAYAHSLNSTYKNMKEWLRKYKDQLLKEV